LFNVDTQEPAASMDRLVIRPRMAPFGAQVEALLRFAEAHDVTVVSTACVNAAPVAAVLPPEAVFVPTDAGETAWRDRLGGDCRRVWIEKRSCGSREANVGQRAFDPFHANPHAAEAVRSLGISHYAVFGDSAAYCLRCTAEGLLGLGCRVTLLADAIGPGIDDERRKAEVLAELRLLGATVTTTGEFLAGAR
jgi:hypothetical protein